MRMPTPNATITVITANTFALDARGGVTAGVSLTDTIGVSSE